MLILSLDLSTSNSGFAVFDNGELVRHGSTGKMKYKLSSKDRYPAKSARIGKLMAHRILELVEEIQPDLIVIEEISPGFKQGVLQIKSLASLHGMILYVLHDIVDSIYFIPCSGKLKSHGIEMKGWRTILGLKKGKCWKASSMKMVKDLYGIDCENDDVSDAILIGTSYIKMNK